jgi:hypothetical protein
MDMHPRQSIRQAVTAALVAANTAAEDRVFPSREVPWRRTQLPGLAVYTLEEAVNEQELIANPGASLRVLQLGLLAVVEVTERMDDAIDALCLEVEAAVAKAEGFGIEAVISVRMRDTKIEIAEDQGRPLGVASLRYEIQYASSL